MSDLSQLMYIHMYEIRLNSNFKKCLPCLKCPVVYNRVGHFRNFKGVRPQNKKTNKQKNTAVVSDRRVNRVRWEEYRDAGAPNIKYTEPISSKVLK